MPTTVSDEKKALSAESSPENKETKGNAISSRRTLPLDAIRPGATVRVSQKIIEGNKERIQVFEGIVLSRRGEAGPNETITVRKVSQGYGVERIYPLSLPTITNIDIVKQARVRRAKLGYLRHPRAKKLKETK